MNFNVLTSTYTYFNAVDQKRKLLQKNLIPLRFKGQVRLTLFYEFLSHDDM